MNAVRALQSIGGGARTLQPQGDFLLRQLFERTVGRRSFSIDAQSQRIINETPVAWALWNSLRVAITPADLSAARLEQVRQIRDQPPRPQQCECEDLRIGERFTHASRRR